MSLLTALRTAALSALAARELAQPDAQVHALIGAGSQAEIQALASRTVLGLEQLRVFDIDSLAVEKVRRNHEPLGIRVHVADSLEEAIDGGDVVTTRIADKAHNPEVGRA